MNPERISVQFRNATVTVIDEPSKSVLHLRNVEGDGSRAKVDESSSTT